MDGDADGGQDLALRISPDVDEARAEGPEWVDLSARVQRIAASRTGRTDLVVRVAPTVRRDSLAWSGWYFHDQAEIRLPAGELLAPTSSAREIDLTSHSGRDLQPGLAGALCVALAHAAHTRWARSSEMDPKLAACLDLLERCRVVARAVEERPADRQWLRAATTQFTPAPAVWASLALLGLARAGVLTDQETVAARGHLVAMFSANAVVEMERTIGAGLLVPDGDVSEIEFQARRLAALLGSSVPAATEAELDLPTDVRAGIDRLAADRRSPRSMPRTQIPREDDLLVAERDLVRAAADRTFGSTRRPAPPTGTEWVTRTPDDRLRSAAHALAGALRRARYRACDTILVPSSTPPGRLRLAEVMRGQAQRDRDVAVTARPWLQSRRQTVNEPPLRVGLSWDISQSRSPLHDRMADLAWALAWAMHHIDGRLAAVAWNSTTYAVQWPGRLPEAVVEPPCGGTSSGCPQSLRALDGELDLQVASGARLVVVATDGNIPNRRAVRVEVDRLIRYGVTVLWVTSTADPKPPPGAIRVVLPDPDTLVETLGDTISQVLACTET